MNLRTIGAALAALAWTCAPQAATVVHAGRLIDGLADRPVEAVTILVDGNTVQAVKAGYAAPGPGDTLIDITALQRVRFVMKDVVVYRQ